MTVSLEAVKRLVQRFDMNDAIDPEGWDLRELDGAVFANNAYNIVDKHGIYDSYRPFSIQWTKGDTLLGFDLDFDGAEHDKSLNGLQAYISSIVIEAILEIELDADFGAEPEFGDPDSD